MKPVAEYIRTLLYEHDYVALPNFGAFIANYMPSSFNDISGSLMPPQKKIAFNEILKHDDGLLATYISRRESVTIDEAKRTIQNFVSEIKGSLANQRSVHFPRIGEFSLNEENNLVFDPDRRNNFFSESFGMESIFPRTVEKPSYMVSHTFETEETDNVQEESYTSTGRKSKWAYVLYSLPVILVASGLFFVLFSNSRNNENTAKSSFNPLDYIPAREKPVKAAIKDTTENQIIAPSAVSDSTAEVIKPEVTPTVEETPLAEEKNVKKTAETAKTSESLPTINTSEKRYLIVSGIFKSKGNVYRLSANLLKNGFSPRVVEADGLMKVIAAEADTRDEAEVIAYRHHQLIGEKPAIIKSK